MENFELGNHVVIELVDERKLAGYLVSVEDDGLILKVTHKDMEMIRTLSYVTKAAIESELARWPGIRLRLSAVLHGKPGAALFGRGALESIMYAEIEQDILASKDDGMQLREMHEPVLTFMSYGMIALMEATDDKLLDAEITKFDSALDGTIQEILDNTPLTKPQAAADSVEVEEP